MERFTKSNKREKLSRKENQFKLLGDKRTNKSCRHNHIDKITSKYDK